MFQNLNELGEDEKNKKEFNKEIIKKVVGALLLIAVITIPSVIYFESIVNFLGLAANAVGTWFSATIVPEVKAAVNFLGLAANAVGTWFSATIVPGVKAAVKWLVSNYIPIILGSVFLAIMAIGGVKLIDNINSEVHSLTHRGPSKVISSESLTNSSKSFTQKDDSTNENAPTKKDDSTNENAPTKEQQQLSPRQ